VRLTAGESHPVFASSPILLHCYRVAEGGSLAIDDAGAGQAVFIRSGEVEVAGQLVGAGGSIVIEHGAGITVSARSPADLLSFANGVGNAKPTRAGGHVHILPPGAVPRSLDFHGDRRAGGALFADAACPTCEMWLHETILHPGGHDTPVHSHSEDEVIVVLDGEIVLGRRGYGPGTAIAIARETLYGFRSGEQGLVFINFRPHSPVYVPGDRTRETVDERAFFLARMPAPQPVTIASGARAEGQ
jgi:hypothetical protein